jgi:CheY-like chemotaxis protein
VNSAAAALDALAAGRTIDVVFSDVMMPGGMSGVDLAREVRRRRPDLPVVLTTGYIEVARTAMAEGLQVLVKPYQLETLARVLDSHVAARLVSAQ